LNERTAKILEGAKEQEGLAEELRLIMYWRNMKLKMILSMVSFATVFSFVIPVVQKFI